MKKIMYSIVILAFGFVAQSQEIKWLTLNEALTLQKKTPKPIFMDVYTDWCGPCKMLDAKTFHDKAFMEHISKNFYAVKFNAEGNSEVNYKGKKYTNPDYKAGQSGRNGTHQFTNFLNLEGYPTMIVFDAKGTISKTVVGYRTPEQLLPEIK
jgi:thioredoxin-related protein